MHHEACIRREDVRELEAQELPDAVMRTIGGKIMSNLDVADHFGYEIQSEQLVEECAELIQAVNKYRRARGAGQPTALSEDSAFGNLIEEIADVESMLEQIKYLLKIPQEMIEGIKEVKTDRINLN